MNRPRKERDGADPRRGTPEAAPPPRRASGFTLLEVLVALAILSGTLFLCFQVVSGAIAAATRSERWTTAALIGEEKLREVSAGFPEVQETEGTFPEPHEEYAFKVSVVQAMHPDAREVHVEVSWGQGREADRLLLSGLSTR